MQVGWLQPLNSCKQSSPFYKIWCSFGVLLFCNVWLLEINPDLIELLQLTVQVCDQNYILLFFLSYFWRLKANIRCMHSRLLLLITASYCSGRKSYKSDTPVQTVRFKNELERNITIKLGYANAKIYKCEDDRCPRPMCYK